MFYHLLQWMQDNSWLPVNVFQYVTFRAAVAGVTALLISLTLGPRVIAILQLLKMGQPIRTVTIKDAPDLAAMHGKKAGTPTMGGVLIVGAFVIPMLLWCDLLNPIVWLLILVTFGFASIGFLDDYLKITKRNADGLSARGKILGQLAIGLCVGAYLYFFGIVEYRWVEEGTRMGPIRGYGHVLFPFVKQWYPWIGMGFILFVALVLVARSNAVNLTDGLDGLCIGISAVVALAFGIVAYIASSKIYSQHLMMPWVPHSGELVVAMAALVGACFGFLWFNAYPADMFMGDTGSLTLGGVISTVAVVTKQEFLLAIIGGIYVIEAMSVIIQVASFKLRGRRVFLMSPLHHHYERKGMPESKIIVRFWIVTALLALAGLSSLKLR